MLSICIDEVVKLLSIWHFLALIFILFLTWIDLSLCVCINEVIDLAVILGKIDLFWHSVIGV